MPMVTTMKGKFIGYNYNKYVYVVFCLVSFQLHHMPYFKLTTWLPAGLNHSF